MKTRLFRPLAKVRHAILLPIAAVSCVALLAVALTGGSAIFASRDLTSTLRATQTASDLARTTAGHIAATHAYANDILSMSKMATRQEVSDTFERHITRLTEDMQALKSLRFDQTMSEKIDALEAAMELWIDKAAVLLSLRATSEVPALWSLQQSAQDVETHAGALVSRSQTLSAEIALRAQQSLHQTIFAVAALTTVICAFVILFAMRMARRLSNSMNDVSRALVELADMEGPTADRKEGEISAMFAALNVLRNSIHEKSQLAQELIYENRRAEEAVQTKARFLANMSHEIRTPINGILGMAEVLSSTELDLEQQECSRTICTASEALLSVINGILDFSKNESGETKLVREPFDLYRLVYDVAALLAPTAGAKDVEICVDYAADIPRAYLGDAQRFRQILLNLVGNAVKFTPGGFVSIGLRYEACAHPPLTLTVTDNGIGIPEDRLDDIFVAFQQIDMKSTRKFDGTGLGLAITKQLVDLMAGTIEVTSTEGGGTTFTVGVHLPLTEDSVPEDAPIVFDAAQLSGKRALIVDDLDINRSILRRRLSLWDMAVSDLSSGVDLLTKIDKDPDYLWQFDVVIIDYNMPEIDGVDVIRRLNQHGVVLPCPVILYSSSDKLAELDRLKKLGFAALLMKPARSDAMAQALIQAMGAASVAPNAQRRAPKDVSLEEARVLIAEDNHTNQLVVRKLLAKTGATLTFCDNGSLAVEAYQANGADVILMDMSMPVMDGLTATRKIRSLEANQDWPPCPIIALTANAMEEDRTACQAAGMDAFLSKPVRKADLIDTLQQQLSSDPIMSTKAQNRS